jgi:hypothetical protein
MEKTNDADEYKELVDVKHIFPLPDGVNEDHAVGALPAPDPEEDACCACSKSSGMSQGTVFLSFSLCQWLNMKPILSVSEWADTYESETWYKYVLQAHNSVEEVASPLDSILSSLLKAYDAVDTKVEEQFVAKRDLPADLTSDVDDLKNQLESVQEFLWGYSSVCVLCSRLL